MRPPHLTRLHKPIFAGVFAGIVLAGVCAVGATRWTVPVAPVGTVAAAAAPAALHVKTPNAVKGIYMSQCVVGTPSFRDSLVKLIDDTDLNTVVIDIKDFSGTISFRPDDGSFANVAVKECGAPDLADFITRLHEKGIYVIGRITVFQDPTYTKAHPDQAVQSISRPGEPWRDHKGLSFVDVSSRPFWEYIVALSKESYAIGFDEINYDYIRYPSDGNMKDAAYVNPNKQEALERFFSYLHQEVAPLGVVMSADLFGYVTVHTDDLGIGQVLERALPYFDFIDPMVYPSHYNSGFAGLTDVNADPYTVVYVSLVEAARRAEATTTINVAFGHTAIASTSPQLYKKPAYSRTKIRPWLQSFDYPVVYTPQMVADQIRANEDAGLTSYLFWDAGNKYTALRRVLTSAP